MQDTALDNCTDGAPTSQASTTMAHTVVRDLLHVSRDYGPDMEMWISRTDWVSCDENVVAAIERNMSDLWCAGYADVQLLAEIALEARTPWKRLDHATSRRAVRCVRQSLRDARDYCLSRSQLLKLNRYNAARYVRDGLSVDDMAAEVSLYRDEARRRQPVIECLRHPRFPFEPNQKTSRSYSGTPPEHSDGPARSDLSNISQTGRTTEADAKALPKKPRRCEGAAGGVQDGDLSRAPVLELDTSTFTRNTSFNVARQAVDLCSFRCIGLIEMPWIAQLIDVRRQARGAQWQKELADVWVQTFQALRRIAQVAVLDVKDAWQDTTLELFLEISGYVTGLLAKCRAACPVLAQAVDVAPASREADHGTSYVNRENGLIVWLDRTLEEIAEEVKSAKGGTFSTAVRPCLNREPATT